ncbi:MAG: hypothetical protein L6455_07955 [Kiritimatiellae bacterium]|nr:hypothetical protein [Kiritimatiellia bacterium]
MRTLTIIVFIIQMFAAYQVEASESLADLPFPKDVSFGISPSELQKARPSVRIRDSSGATGMFGAVENISEKNGVIAAYVYHFKEGKLGAIIYNRTSTNMLADVETKRLYTKLLAWGETPATMLTARAGQVLTVKHWKNTKSNVAVCLEATTRGTTITFFSPAIFAVEDLFPNVSEKSKQDAILGQRQTSSANVGKGGNRSVDRLSSDAPPHCALVGE